MYHNKVNCKRFDSKFEFFSVRNQQVQTTNIDVHTEKNFRFAINFISKCIPIVNNTLLLYDYIYIYIYILFTY